MIPALFALALAASSANPAARGHALANLSKVARIPTHLFHFLDYVTNLRGFGRGLKRAVANWYQDMPVEKLAYEIVKYQARDGWSNRDALRLSHPKTTDATRNFIYRYITHGLEDAKAKSPDYGIPVPSIIAGFELAKTAKGNTLTDLISTYKLSREMLPTEALNKPEVWEALLPNLGLTAILRNLGNMAKSGLLKPFSETCSSVVSKITNKEDLKKSRVHPFSILLALRTYKQGHGNFGHGSWTVSKQIIDALDDAFYEAFDYVEPSGKRIVLGIDVSGSMHAQVAKMNMPASEAAALMAMACVRTERNYEIVCFDTKVVGSPVITRKMSLAEVQRAIPRGGATDCSAPMRWALLNRITTDAFVILTDNETWAGKNGHPSQVMTEYRQKLNPEAKIINVGMTATNVIINDPKDFRAMDTVGFDTNAPGIISNFIKE
jgi:60 kDa SS-A/Ro ribonucleoprotein